MRSDGKLFTGQPVPEPRAMGRGACLGDAAFSLKDAAFGLGDAAFGLGDAAFGLGDAAFGEDPGG